MIVLNKNLANPVIRFLPIYDIPSGTSAISDLEVQLIDDETQTKYTYTNVTNAVSGDFVEHTFNDTSNIIEDKYYTLRVLRTDTNKVIYRDKLFATTQTGNTKFDNNVNQYTPADSGNNDYIIL